MAVIVPIALAVPELGACCAKAALANITIAHDIRIPTAVLIINFPAEIAALRAAPTWTHTHGGWFAISVIYYPIVFSAVRNKAAGSRKEL
jgi:hypothetical protein